MKWYSVELPVSQAEKFRKFLKERLTPMETSGAGNLVHFEVFLFPTEVQEVNDFLDTL